MWLFAYWWVPPWLVIIGYSVYWWVAKDKGLSEYTPPPPAPSFELWWTRRFTRAESFEHIIQWAK